MILFKKFFAPITLLLCFTLSLSLTGCSASSAQPFSKTGFYFDTVISLTCYGNDAQAVLNEAFELCEHYENLLSYTKEGSDIWNINHANGQPVTVDSLSLIHISEPTRRTPISYAVFCLKKKKNTQKQSKKKKNNNIEDNKQISEENYITDKKNKNIYAQEHT